MLTEDFLEKLIEENKSLDKTFAEFIALSLKGKLVEIYLGDSFEEVSTEQVSTSYPAVFCGTIIGAYKECLIIKTVFSQKKLGKPKQGNIMFISERAIRALNEIDGGNTIDDIFVKSRNSGELK